ncbi:transposable element Tcb2 transposase [Trichonephila clavipes]|nr:transposable element Tcb2 transposase [Trichonephila clavipes]
MTQRTHLDDFLNERIIARLDVSVLGWKYPRNLESPRVSSPGFGNDSKMMVIHWCGSFKVDRVQISLCARNLSQTTYCNLPSPAVSVEYRAYIHCGHRNNESGFSLQFDSRGTFLWRAQLPVTTKRTSLNDIVLEFVFMDDNTCFYRANIVNECLQLEDITRIDYMLGQRVAARQLPPACLLELRRALLDEWCNIPQYQIDNLIFSMPKCCTDCIASSGRHTTY